MSAKKNFWIDSAPKWETSRYKSFLSKLFFSSLRFRRNYLLFILNQLPRGARVLELGCGSGLLYGELRNKENLTYTGLDISPEAITAAARNYPSAEWLCDSVENIKGRPFDYVISAGLLDWIGDAAIQSIVQNFKTAIHVHSFSENTKSASTSVHRLFARLVSKKSGIRYEPRKFETAQILDAFKPLDRVIIVRDQKLSFGAFVHNLPPDINSSFQSMLTADYFSNKNRMSSVESLIKQAEHKAVKSSVDVSGKRVLEAGSGQGYYSRWLLQEKPSTLLCVDAFVETPDFVPEIKGCFQKLAVENLKGGPFDVVLALGVLEFVPDKGAFLRHLLSLTAPRARLLVLVPRGSGLVRLIYGWFHSLRGIKVPANLDVFLTEFLAQHARKTSFTKISGGPLNFLFIIKTDE